MTKPDLPMNQLTKAAKRREADRMRKRDARAKEKAENAPHSSLVDWAIADAMSFCVNNADRSVWRNEDGWSPINAAVIYAAALDILTLRFHKDHGKSVAALGKRLGQQERHRTTGCIPSTRPAPGHPRYRLDAPKDTSARKLPAPPLHPRDVSKSRRVVQHISDN